VAAVPLALGPGKRESPARSEFVGRRETEDGEEKGRWEMTLTCGARLTEGEGEWGGASALGLRGTRRRHAGPGDQSERGGKGPALRGIGPGLGPRGKKRKGEEREPAGEEERREKGNWAGPRVWGWAAGCFLSFLFLFYTLPIQTKPFEFKYHLNSNLHTQHN
jgi:hypothetical protein